MKNLLLFSLLLTISVGVKSQNSLQVICELPESLDEISGMAYDLQNDILWTINDSGNDAVLLGFNKKKKQIVSKAFLDEGFNEDWEDLAHNLDTLYIADTGNNDFNREFFTIYILTPDISERNTVVKTESIKIDFPDEDKKKDNIRFDIEAMIYWQGDLYFFTKTNRGKFKDRTKVFCVRASPGRHEAIYLGTIELCGKEKNCKITGAAMHQQSGTLALLSHKNLYVITDFNKSISFTDSQKTRYEFNDETQKEGVTFLNATTILISEEKTKGPNYLYQFSIKKNE